MKYPCYIELFGELTVWLGEREITEFRAKQKGRLVAYLALHRGQMLTRDAIAEAVWHDAPSLDHARNNLRVALHRLRHLVEANPLDGPILSTQKMGIGFTEAVITDVGRFESLLRRVDRATSLDERATHGLQAACLYRPDLLAGQYDDWVLPQQSQFAAQFQTIVRVLTEYYEQHGDLAALITSARQILSEGFYNRNALTRLARFSEAWAANTRPVQASLSGNGKSRSERERWMSGVGAHQMVLGALRQAHSTEMRIPAVLNPPVPVANYAVPAVRPASLTSAPPPPSVPVPVRSRSVAPGLTHPSPVTPKEQPTPLPIPSFPEEAPPLRLPVPLTRFWGRNDEREQLALLLDLRDSRLVTLTGLGGVGKTRLALACAQDAQEGGSSVYYVSLTGTQSITDIAQAVEHALGLPAATQPERGTKREREAELTNRVTAALDKASALLVLDGADLVLEQASAFVLEVLQTTHSVACLVTSRQRLGIPGEQVFSLAPLPIMSALEWEAAFGQNQFGAARPIPMASLPGDDTLDALAQQAAVALFLDRARLTKHDFRLTRSNAAAIAALVAGLDGIPLAIELAATRISVLTPQMMLGQIGRRFDLLRPAPSLQTTQVSSDDRHRSLRETLAWTYRLLPAALQHLLAQMSVFQGGWDAQAAAAVADREGDPLSLLDDLWHLCNASFVQATEEDGTMRFCLLDTVREFAGEQNEAVTRTAGTLHLRYFAAQVQEAQANLHGPDQHFWLDWLTRETANVRAAFAFCLNTDGWAAQTGLQMAYNCAAFWNIRGRHAEGRRILEQLQERCVALCPPNARRDATAWNARGILALWQCDWDDARTCLRQAEMLYGEVGEDYEQAKVLNNLSIADSEAGKFDAAREGYETALLIFRKAGDLNRIAATLTNLGVDAVRRCEFARAHELHQEALALRRGNPRGEAISLGNLGHLFQVQEQWNEAHRYFRDSLRLLQTSGDDMTVLLVLNIGLVAVASGDLGRGERLIESALALCKAQGVTLPSHWRNDLARYQAQVNNALYERRDSAQNPAFLTINEIIAEALRDKYAPP